MIPACSVSIIPDEKGNPVYFLIDTKGRVMEKATLNELSKAWSKTKKPRTVQSVMELIYKNWRKCNVLP